MATIDDVAAALDQLAYRVHAPGIEDIHAMSPRAKALALAWVFRSAGDERRADYLESLAKSMPRRRAGV